MHPDIERARIQAETRESLPAIMPGPGGKIDIDQLVASPRRRGRPPKAKLAVAKTDAAWKEVAAASANHQATAASIDNMHEGSLQEFPWTSAPLDTCSRYLKRLQDEAARGIAVLSQRQPRQEMVECWCRSHDAKVNGKLPDFAEGGTHLIGPGQRFGKYVASVTVRTADSQLVNLFFATTLCYLKFQQRKYGTRDLPALMGR